MTDVFDAAKRSSVMSSIRSADTKPELFVRRLLFAGGFRYRLRRSDLPGKPDIVLPKWKALIFVNGCFWHQHEGCRRATIPASRLDYWLPKLRRNVERDADEISRLRKMGWRICIVWECACRKGWADALQDALKAFLTTPSDACIEIGRDWQSEGIAVKKFLR